MSVELPVRMSHQSVSAFAELAKAQAAAAGQPSGTAVAIHPPRATDAFYAKLLPALEVPVCPQSIFSTRDMHCVQQVWHLLPYMCLSACLSRRT